MQKVVVALLVAIGALVPTTFSFAMTLTPTACNAGNSADDTTPACAGSHLPYVYGANPTVPGISSHAWLTFEPPNDPGTITSATLTLTCADSAYPTWNTGVKVYSGKKDMPGTNVSTWEEYNSGLDWDNAGGSGMDDRDQTPAADTLINWNAGCSSIFGQATSTITLDPDWVHLNNEGNIILHLEPKDADSYFAIQGLTAILEINEGPASGGYWDCADCSENPLLNPSLTVGSQTATTSAIFVPYIDSAFPMSTNTIPICFVRHAFRGLDSVIGLFTADYASTTPLTFEYPGYTPIVFTLEHLAPEDMPEWIQDLITLYKTIFVFAGWSMLGWTAFRQWVGGQDE